MQEIPALITDLTIILVVAALTTLLCKKINLPSVLGYILAGFLAGPVVQFLPTIEDLGSIEVWSDIGVIFLMFGLGLEFSIHKMAEVGVPGFLSAGVQAVGMGAVGVLVGLALGWGTMNSVFLGVMLAMSSTMITMKSIEDLGLKKNPSPIWPWARWSSRTSSPFSPWSSSPPSPCPSPSAALPWPSASACCCCTWPCG